MIYIIIVIAIISNAGIEGYGYYRLHQLLDKMEEYMEVNEEVASYPTQDEIVPRWTVWWFFSGIGAVVLGVGIIIGALIF